MPSPLIATLTCIISAANLQQVPAAVVFGILKTEGGHAGSMTPNNNGSYDLGPMQINDRTWVPRIAIMHFGGNQRAAEQELRDNVCYNIHIGTWIYRLYLDEAGGNLADAVGYYNSHSPLQMQTYQRKFARNLLALFGNRGD